MRNNWLRGQNTSEYKLKGVIKEITSNSSNYDIRITGTTNCFAKFDNTEFNLLWDSLTKSVKAIELSQTYLVDIKNEVMINLINVCYANSKPIEVFIEEDLTDSNNPKYTIKSITALSNI